MEPTRNAYKIPIEATDDAHIEATDDAHNEATDDAHKGVTTTSTQV